MVLLGFSFTVNSLILKLVSETSGSWEKCENNILLHHSGPHHFTKSVVIWMSFIIIVTLIFATSKVFSGLSAVCIFTDVLDLL